MEVKKEKRYHGDNESTVALLGGDSKGKSRNAKRCLRPCTIVIVCNFSIFLTSLAMLITSIRISNSTHHALKLTSTYSPVLEDINIHLQTTKFNGSLLPGPDPSPWRGTPDDQIAEAAWDSFEHIRTIPLTRKDVLKMGKDLSTVAQFPDSVFHLGSDAYIGALDIFHQIHCLNMLRKAAFQGNSGLAGGTKLETIHLQHCTDMLMQHLLCTGDTGMITYQWVEDNEHPFPDFSVERKCRDWRQLVEWRDEKAVDLETYMNFTKPERVSVRKWGKEYWGLMRELNETDSRR